MAECPEKYSRVWGKHIPEVHNRMCSTRRHDHELSGVVQDGHEELGMCLFELAHILIMQPQCLCLCAGVRIVDVIGFAAAPCFSTPIQCTLKRILVHQALDFEEALGGIIPDGENPPCCLLLHPGFFFRYTFRSASITLPSRKVWVSMRQAAVSA